MPGNFFGGLFHKYGKVGDCIADIAPKQENKKSLTDHTGCPTLTLKPPLNPGVQVQLKSATKSTHEAPLAQGLDQHSSQSVSQCVPVKPSSQ